MQYSKFAVDQAEENFLRRAHEGAVFGNPYGVGITRRHYDTIIMDDIIHGENMKQLYWVAVLYRKGKKTELVVEPEIMLAVSEEKAKAGMINRIPSSYKERFDRLEVVVRPF